MTNSAIAVSSPWYRTLTREQWRVLLASNLGWLFDGFEIYALFLTVGFALHQLIEASQYAQIPRYAGYVLATTVFGWATGGVIGGIVADYIGRKRTMMLAVLAYTLTTGLSAIAWNWASFAILRFLVGVGIGSEWVTGASLVSEVWPDHARGKGGGLLQSGAGIGSFLASGVWLLIGDMGPNAWRGAHRGRCSAHPLHRRRHVHRPNDPQTACARVPYDAVSDLRVLGGCDLRSHLCRNGRH